MMFPDPSSVVGYIHPDAHAIPDVREATSNIVKAGGRIASSQEVIDFMQANPGAIPSGMVLVDVGNLLSSEREARMMCRLRAELDNIIENMPDPVERDQAPPKTNVNGRRMATQPLTASQNYLTLRNKRW
jgi:hypothetical protein